MGSISPASRRRKEVVGFMGSVSVQQGNAAPKQKVARGSSNPGPPFSCSGDDYCLKKIGSVIVVAIGCPSFVAGA